MSPHQNYFDSKDFWAIGLMSGTSLDGIDGAVIKTDGERISQFGVRLFYRFSANEKELLHEITDKIINLDVKHYDRARSDNTAGIYDKTKIYEQVSGLADLVDQGEQMLDCRHADVALRLMSGIDQAKKNHINQLIPAIIGYHGQTILHRPDLAITIQLGQAERLAKKLKTPVVYDFRSNDVKHGGQGAPLVPVYIQALAAMSRVNLPLAIVNIGGVANITYIDDQGAMQAFDVGPGNGLIDSWMQQHTASNYDENGSFAATGTIDNKTLADMLADKYFKLKPPKSLDRYYFSIKPVSHLTPADGAATLTAFTAAAIAQAIAVINDDITRIVISGGGSKNSMLMTMIARQTGLKVIKASALGWDDSFIEAEAFAFLAVRSIKGKVLSFPATTGVTAPQTGGRIVYP